MDEINRLCSITDFNDTFLLDGSRKTDINLQVGLYSDQRCVIKMDSFLFASCESTSLMGFRSAATATKDNPGYIDLRTSNQESDVYCYRARLVNENGELVDENNKLLPPGAEPKYQAGYYASALAAALAESGDVTYTDGATSAVIAGNAKNFTIEQMCTAIYRNDSSARAFIDNIDKAIDNVSLRVTKIGAYMNRLDSAIDATDVQKENLTEAISTMKDADVAEESSKYIKFQILQQATATLLATANQQPQIALNLR
jgi:flagellin-like hook-associated protein FlgL